MLGDSCDRSGCSARGDSRLCRHEAGDLPRRALAKSSMAPPARIFELINDFHRWAAWSPWEKLDPAMKKTFAALASGKGAVYEWAGNSKAGEGRMEITGTSPGSKVTIKLDFLKPFEAHNTAEFTLDARGWFHQM